MSEWKPIKTAPTDGTEFLAYDPVSRKYDVCVLRLVSDAWGWDVYSTQFDGEYGPMEDQFDGGRATRWLSLDDLPTPPKE